MADTIIVHLKENEIAADFDLQQNMKFTHNRMHI